MYNLSGKKYVEMTSSYDEGIFGKLFSVSVIKYNASLYLIEVQYLDQREANSPML